MESRQDTQIRAEEFRQSHCDRKGYEHQCVGVVTINRAEMSLDCRICGTGNESLENIQPLIETAKAICAAAGTDYFSLDCPKRRSIMLSLLAFKDY